ncbi:MAG: Trk family potassium uptake protein, partial [Oscillospiraceae bacterium]|nr:Trk family potassium uptake protein [Oscillospiraceae bacterium]
TSVCVMRGKEKIVLFGRSIPAFAVLKSVAVVTVASLLSALGAVFVAEVNEINMVDSVFECVSAFSTTGLSTGVTPGLSDMSKLILICLMYFGRVGLLTISIGLIAVKKTSKISYPEGKIIIG